MIDTSILDAPSTETQTTPVVDTSVLDTPVPTKEAITSNGIDMSVLEEDKPGFFGNVAKSYEEASKNVMDLGEAATAHGESSYDKTVGGLAGLASGLTVGIGEAFGSVVEKNIKFIGSQLEKKFGDGTSDINWEDPKVTKELGNYIKDYFFKGQQHNKSFEAGEAAAGLPFAFVQAFGKTYGPEAGLAAETILMGLGAKGMMSKPKPKKAPTIDETPNRFAQGELFEDPTKLVSEVNPVDLTQDQFIKKYVDPIDLATQEVETLRRTEKIGEEQGVLDLGPEPVPTSQRRAMPESDLNLNQLETLADHIKKDMPTAARYYLRAKEGTPESILRSAAESTDNVQAFDESIHNTVTLGENARFFMERGDIKAALDAYLVQNPHSIVAATIQKLKNLEWNDVTLSTKIPENYRNVARKDATTGKDITGKDPPLGLWDPVTKTISVNLDKPNSGITFLHELTHAATDHVLLFETSGRGKTLRNELFKIMKAYEAQFGITRSEMQTSMWGLSDNPHLKLREFVAEVWTNKVVRTRLREMSDPIFGTKLGKFAAAIDRVMGTATGMYMKGEWKLPKSPLAKGERNILPRTIQLVEDIIDYGGPNVGWRLEHAKAASYGAKAVLAEAPAQPTNGKDIFKARSEWTFKKALKIIGKPDKTDKNIDTSGITLNTASWLGRIKTMGADAMNNKYWQWYKWADDTIQNIKEKRHGAFSEVRDDIRSIYDLAKKGNTSLKNIVKVGLDLERDSGKWFNGINYWPDAMTLRGKGLTDPEISVYQAMTRIADKQWSMLETSAKLMGKTLGPRVPGFMPHVWNGMYRVKFRDSTGKIVPMIYSAGSKLEMDIALRRMKKELDAQGLKVDSIEEPFFESRIDASLLDLLAERRSEMAALKGADVARWKKLITLMEKSGHEGIISHMLERNRKPLAGHELDIVAKGGKKGIIPREATGKEIAQSFERVFDAVNEFSTNAEIVNDTWVPMTQKGILDNAQFREVFMNRLLNAINKDGNMLQLFESSIQNTFVSMGLNPQLPTSAFKNTAHVAALFYLGGKAAFLAANILQPTRLVAQHQLSKAELAKQGIKNLPSINKAMRDSFVDFNSMFDIITKVSRMEKMSTKDLMKNLSPVVEEMVRRGAVEPATLDMVVPSRMHKLSKITGMEFFKHVEMVMRSFVYLQGYHFYKQMKNQGWSNNQIHSAAKDFTDRTMVGYSKDYHAPTILSKFGLTGNPVGLFQIYRAHEGGMLYNMGKGILKAENPKAKAYYASALATTLATYGAIGGLSALPFASDWDDIVFWANKWFGTELKDTKDLARQASEGMDPRYRHMMQFGVPSEQLGVNISPSMGSFEAGGIPGEAFFTMFGNVAEAAYLGYKGYGEPSGALEKDKAAFTRRLPSQWREGVNNAMAAYRDNDGPVNIVNSFVERMLVKDDRKHFSTGTDFGVKYERTKKDQLLQNFGLTSVEEADFNIKQNIINRITTRTMNRIANWQQALNEDLEFNKLSNQDKKTLIFNLVSHGKVPYSSAEDYLIKRNVPIETRQYMNQSANPDPQQIQMLQDVYRR